MAVLGRKSPFQKQKRAGEYLHLTRPSFRLQSLLTKFNTFIFDFFGLTLLTKQQFYNKCSNEMHIAIALIVLYNKIVHL